MSEDTSKSAEKPKRVPISNKVRFEVFKRDKFTCQYCGAAAPDVILQVDHIQPVSSGGDNDLLNLITSCAQCNSGKGPRELTDDTAIAKQRAQLEELEERRQQLEMMVMWRETVANLAEQEIDAIENAIRKKTGYGLNGAGRQTAQRWLRRFPLMKILDAVDRSFEQYIRSDSEGAITSESWEKAFAYVPRILRVDELEKHNPHIKELFYIRGILRNRLNYVNEHQAISLMQRCVDAGASIESMREFSKVVRNWTAFRDDLLNFLDDHETRDGEDG